MIIDTYNRIPLYIELFSLKALFFVEGFRKYPKAQNKRALRVSQYMDIVKNNGKTAQFPCQSTAIAKMFLKNHNRGVWLFLVSVFTLNKYPCKTSFRYNSGLTFLHPVTTIPKTHKLK